MRGEAPIRNRPRAVQRLGDFIMSKIAWIVVLLSISLPAHAVVNAGAEGGLIKRSADAPSNLGVGLGIGLHAEFDVARWLEVGPYYLYAALPNEGVPSVFDAVVQTPAFARVGYSRCPF